MGELVRAEASEIVTLERIVGGRKATGKVPRLTVPIVFDPDGIAGSVVIPTLPIVLLPVGNTGKLAIPTVPILADPAGNEGNEVTPTVPIAELPEGNEGMEVTATEVAIPPPPLLAIISVLNQIETFDEVPPATAILKKPAPEACPAILPICPVDNAIEDPIFIQGPEVVGAICILKRKEFPAITEINAIIWVIPSAKVTILVVETPEVDTPA